MRIVVVSAHYPPNFVSGGTLQPQRLARGLRRRGNDVRVYAGRLDAARPALETSDDFDETGLAVRWVNTTPYTGWDDGSNFDNPAVADDFGRFLARVEPDLVHLHSLQSLGGELVAVAARSAAAVVVTMHDFWWCCARQFLVDRSFVPCALVTDAGVCPCEVDVAWRDARAARLQGWLAPADCVLAPPASAASVRAAPGIDAEVDENGLPPEARPTAAGAR
ncbi:MAG: glycosyltransferase, partial [Acidimicrobiia bacterium]